MTLRVSPDVRWRTIDGEVVIVSQTRGEVLGLNETGSRLLELIAAGTSLADAARKLSEEFDAPAADVDAQVRALADDLVRAGVLEERA